MVEAEAEAFHEGYFAITCVTEVPAGRSRAGFLVRAAGRTMRRDIVAILYKAHVHAQQSRLERGCKAASCPAVADAGAGTRHQSSSCAAS